MQKYANFAEARALAEGVDSTLIVSPSLTRGLLHDAPPLF
jgi:hypothetical protein